MEAGFGGRAFGPGKALTARRSWAWTNSSRSCRPVTSGAPSQTTRSALRPLKCEMICSAVLGLVMSPSIWTTPVKGACGRQLGQHKQARELERTDHRLQVDRNDFGASVGGRYFGTARLRSAASASEARPSRSLQFLRQHLRPRACRSAERVSLRGPPGTTRRADAPGAAQRSTQRSTPSHSWNCSASCSSLYAERAR